MSGPGINLVLESLQEGGRPDAGSKFKGERRNCPARLGTPRGRTTLGRLLSQPRGKCKEQLGGGGRVAGSWKADGGDKAALVRDVGEARLSGAIASDFGARLRGSGRGAQSWPVASSAGIAEVDYFALAMFACRCLGGQLLGLKFRLCCMCRACLGAGILGSKGWGDREKSELRRQKGGGDWRRYWEAIGQGAGQGTKYRWERWKAR